MKKEEHPFEPYIPHNTSKLIIGTIPPPRFAKGKLKDKDINFYYGSKENTFWNLMFKVFNSAFEAEGIREITKWKKLLEKNNIGICDIVKSTNRKKPNSALDDDLVDPEYLNLVKLLDENKNIDTLLYTSEKVKTFVYQYLKQESQKEICHKSISKEDKQFSLDIKGKIYTVYILPSPSRRNTMAVEKKINIYKKIFTSPSSHS